MNAFSFLLTSGNLTSAWPFFLLRGHATPWPQFFFAAGSRTFPVQCSPLHWKSHSQDGAAGCSVLYWEKKKRRCCFSFLKFVIFFWAEKCFYTNNSLICANRANHLGLISGDRMLFSVSLLLRVFNAVKSAYLNINILPALALKKGVAGGGLLHNHFSCSDCGWASTPATRRLQVRFIRLRFALLLRKFNIRLWLTARSGDNPEQQCECALLMTKLPSVGLRMRLQLVMGCCISTQR